MYIQSAKNERVKQWRKLTTKKEREKTRTYRIEGFHLVEEAIKSGANIKEIMIESDIETNLLKQFPEEKIFTLSPEAAQAVSGTETTQGIFAIIEMPEEQELEEITAPFLLLDQVQDPGNVGTMIRTADAAGFQGVILGEGSADVYNDKTLRSAQGSHFHLSLYRKDLNEILFFFKNKKIPIYGTALNKQAKSYRSLLPSDPFALIMGNEGNGMSEELLNQTTENLYIPILGEAESLNVGVAAGILMFSLWQG